MNVLTAVLEREAGGAEITTLIPHGTEMPAGRALGNVMVVVGVQLEELEEEDEDVNDEDVNDEDDDLVSLLTTMLISQGVDNWVGRLMWTVMVVVGVQAVVEVLVLESVELELLLTELLVLELLVTELLVLVLLLTLVLVVALLLLILVLALLTLELELLLTLVSLLETTKLTPQGGETTVGKLWGIVIVVVGVQMEDELAELIIDGLAKLVVIDEISELKGQAKFHESTALVVKIDVMHEDVEVESPGIIVVHKSSERKVEYPLGSLKSGLQGPTIVRALFVGAISVLSDVQVTEAELVGK